MANKGNLYLKNESVIALYDSTKAYETTVLETLYAQYKTAFKISKSNYFTGAAASNYKNYFTNGEINIICGLMDIASDMTMVIQLFAEAFYEYERNHEGKVDEGALDYINATLASKKKVFDEATTELNAVTTLASNFIKTNNLYLGCVDKSYYDTKKEVSKIRKNLYATDDEALKAANELLERIKEQKALINKMMAFCYDEGIMVPANIKMLGRQDWFHTTGSATLYLMLEEDPFAYAAGEVTLSEAQWAIGLCSNVYAYAGYSFLTASGEAGIEDGTAFAKGKAAVLNVNGYAQFTDYLSAEATGKALYAEGEAKAGWSDKYKGFSVEGDVGVLKGETMGKLGNDNANIYAKGVGQILCADGKAAYEVEENGDYAIGFGGAAVAAAVEGKAGFSLLSYENKDLATGSRKPLFGVRGGGNIGVDANFEIWAETETAIEMKYVNIKATTITVSAAALLGVDVSITIPDIYFNSSW